MNIYRQPGRPPVVEEDDRPRVNRRELFWALLPVVIWVTVQVVFALYFEGLLGLAKMFLLWAAFLGGGGLITKIGLTIQAYLAKRRPDFGRDQLARDTQAFLKDAKEAARQPYRLEGAPANDVGGGVEDWEATESARGLRKTEPW